MDSQKEPKEEIIHEESKFKVTWSFAWSLWWRWMVLSGVAAIIVWMVSLTVGGCANSLSGLP